jgi:LysR family glycine cleavage system transcriptional activator
LVLVHDELQAGHLVQPFGPEIDGHTYHLAMFGEKAPAGAVQAVADWLRTQT